MNSITDTTLLLQATIVDTIEAVTGRAAGFRRGSRDFH